MLPISLTPLLLKPVSKSHELAKTIPLQLARSLRMHCPPSSLFIQTLFILRVNPYSVHSFQLLMSVVLLALLFIVSCIVSDYFTCSVSYSSTKTQVYRVRNRTEILLYPKAVLIPSFSSPNHHPASSCYSFIEFQLQMPW